MLAIWTNKYLKVLGAGSVCGGDPNLVSLGCSSWLWALGGSGKVTKSNHWLPFQNR